MPRVATKTRSRVTRADAKALLAWREGVHLEQSSGLSIDQLRDVVTADRVRLASECTRRGVRLMQATPPLYRDAVSRFYYGMYHGLRAVSYHFHGGDDHEAHSELPRFVPARFPDADLWSNRLKSARERRNSADYDPYPVSPSAWRPVAEELEEHATDLIATIRKHLRAQGCQYI